MCVCTMLDYVLFFDSPFGLCNSNSSCILILNKAKDFNFNQTRRDFRDNCWGKAIELLSGESMLLELRSPKTWPRPNTKTTLQSLIPQKLGPGQTPRPRFILDPSVKTMVAGDAWWLTVALFPQTSIKWRLQTNLSRHSTVCYCVYISKDVAWKSTGAVADLKFSPTLTPVLCDI
jgi:hypothetical protein